ncbi:uncharacterized protein PAC_03614 [Phialocephala subalpina]|uniref:Heterokaryon incompatibility domain-containing protein n=1 Tax=Phialocephala subalpina TaxID=576137 RepID=A0A1L7WLU1_9HELO|nr:uncharacterized protein PAC_03614 [Phialocephala subalpina]
MLCEVCNGVFRGSFLDRVRQGHHANIKDLQQASQEGCYICEKIWAHFTETPEREEKLMSRDSEFSSKQSVPPLEPGGTTTQDRKDDRLSESRARYRNFFGHDSPPRDEPVAFLEYRLIHRVNEELELQVGFLTDRWNGPQTPHAGHWLIFEVYPQRDLDDLTPSGNLDVYDHSDYPMRLAKALLDSELLLGNAKFLTLTKETSDMLISGIEVTVLPQTFQDAIQTASILGIVYLWIDSLCIFQDDPQDWLQESSLMGNVYQNGYCNIAATKSSNSHESFLAEKSPRTQAITPPCYIQSTWNDATNSCWHIDIWPRSASSEKYLSGPLLRRGWVVQERILSPRVLHFGSNQISWECYEHFACEAFPNGTHDFDMHKKSKHDHPPLAACTEVWELMQQWPAIVLAFCRCDLTMPKDKLVALSGIAKTIQGRFEGLGYLAGLWNHNLEDQLLWYMMAPAKTRAEPYRAPTWSWVSLDREIWPRFMSFNYSIVEILEASTEPLDHDHPTGQVKRGSIQLAGLLMTISLCRSAVTDSCPHGYDLKVNGEWHLPSQLYQDIKEDPPENLHCMAVTARQGTHPSYDALMIQPVEGAKRGTFRRWGYLSFHFWKYTGGDGPWTDPKWSEIQNEEWFEFEEDRGDGKYTITIV